MRDALKRLEADGAINSRDKSAYFVIELSREQYIEVLDLRLEVEGYAAARAAIEATAADVDRIEALNDLYRKTGSLMETIRINFALHFEVYRLARSPLLIGIIENLWMRVGPSMYLHGDGYDVAAVAENHQRLVGALRRNNPVDAEAALRRDLLDAVRAIAPRLPSRAVSEVKASAYNPALQVFS